MKQFRTKAGLILVDELEDTTLEKDFQSQLNIVIQEIMTLVRLCDHAEEKPDISKHDCSLVKRRSHKLFQIILKINEV